MAELTTLARPYAKAAFEAAQAHGDLARWSDMLGFAAQAAADPDMRRLLANPKLSRQEKADLLIGLQGEWSDQGKNFIVALAENNRLTLLPNIAALFETFRSQLERTVDVQVSAPYEMTDAQQEKLAQALSRKLERKVSLAATVDKSLIGGVVVRTGDMVIDASVRGKLARLAEALGS